MRTEKWKVLCARLEEFSSRSRFSPSCFCVSRWEFGVEWKTVLYANYSRFYFRSHSVASSQELNFSLATNTNKSFVKFRKISSAVFECLHFLHTFPPPNDSHSKTAKHFHSEPTFHNKNCTIFFSKKPRLELAVWMGAFLQQKPGKKMCFLLDNRLD